MAESRGRKPAGKKPAAATDGAHRRVTPSPALAAIVGKDPLPRTEVVSRVWDYIRKHDLQKPEDKRQIRADAALEKVFGAKEASMFELNRHLSAHLS